MSRRRWILLLILAELVLLLGLKAWRGLALAADASAQLHALEGAVDNPLGALSDPAAAGLPARVSALADDLSGLQSEFGPVLVLGPVLEWVPGYGPDLAQAGPLLNFGVALSSSARTSLALAETLATSARPATGTQTAPGLAFLRAVQANAAAIHSVQGDLARARDLRGAIDTSRLSARTRALLQRADRLGTIWSSTLDLVALSPALLGANRPAEYLVIAQNNDELRPSGGFISSAVRVRIANGDVQSLDFRDSYAVDDLTVPHPAPPAALSKFMSAPIWVFRDGNWSPDFPKAAQDVAWLYQIDQKVQVDGVIAVDLNLVPRLLTATGPVRIDGYDGVVTSGNAIDEMRLYWASPSGAGETGDWWLHRKDFTGALIAALVKRIRSGEVNQGLLVRTLYESLVSKDLLIYSRDQGVEAAVRAAGWGGAIDQGAGDALSIVDSNVGFNKVDPNVLRSARYTVRVDADGTGHAELSLDYQNRSLPDSSQCVLRPFYPPRYQDLAQGCYWDYQRIIAAPNARPAADSEAKQALPEASIGDRTVLSDYFTLPRGQSRESSFAFDIPNALVDAGTYRLRVEKQPGAPPLSLHVEINLPAGWQNAEASPAPQQSDGQVLKYDLTVDRNMDIVISRGSGGGPPEPAVFAGGAGVALLCAGVYTLRGKRLALPRRSKVNQG